MIEQARSSEEIQAALKESTREVVILEEMIRLGFWHEKGVIPEDPADEIRRRGELQHELNQLRGEMRKLHNEKKLLQELRKRRLEESRRKQKETKERRQRERQERAEAWRQKKEQEIVYLGDGVSAGLNNTENNLERLARYQLPNLSNAKEIAEAMGITVNELRFLAFSRKTSTVSHYVRFKMKKKTGGERLISAPMPRLKKSQHWILANLLEKVEMHEAAHGFRQERSIVSNAVPHIGAEVIINLDLKDFFPSIAYRRVKGLFRALGYSEAAATIFGLLCTEPDVEEVMLTEKPTTLRPLTGTCRRVRRRVRRLPIFCVVGWISDLRRWQRKLALPTLVMLMI